jgi:hypothetical protein
MRDGRPLTINPHAGNQTGLDRMQPARNILNVVCPTNLTRQTPTCGGREVLLKLHLLSIQFHPMNELSRFERLVILDLHLSSVPALKSISSGLYFNTIHSME